MTNPLVPILLTLLPYSAINATQDTLKNPVPVVQNIPKRELSQKEKEFLWAIKQRHEFIYKTGRDSMPLLDELKELNKDIPEIDFVKSSSDQAKEYFSKLGYAYYEEFDVIDKTKELIPSIYIAEIKEQGKKEMSFNNKKIDLNYIATKNPIIDLYDNFSQLRILSWYDPFDDLVYLNENGLERVLESLNSDTSIVGRLFRQQKDISKDSLMDDYLQSVLTHEAAHKNDNYNHDLTGKEIYAYLNELVYGKTKKGTLANIISLKNSPTKEYKDASDYILGAMGGLGDKPMELLSSHEIKKLAKKALSSYVSALSSKN